MPDRPEKRPEEGRYQPQVSHVETLVKGCREFHQGGREFREEIIGEGGEARYPKKKKICT